MALKKLFDGRIDRRKKLKRFDLSENQMHLIYTSAWYPHYNLPRKTTLQPVSLKFPVPNHWEDIMIGSEVYHNNLPIGYITQVENTCNFSSGSYYTYITVLLNN